MKLLKLTHKHKLILTIAITFAFFVTELIVGFYTHSLALVADAFHYLNDMIGFMVSLAAVVVTDREKPPPQILTYGWKRATTLGAFFNGVFLLALGLSILVQVIERFIEVHPVENPVLILVVGGIGLVFNVVVMSFLHEHGHEHSHHDHQPSEDPELAKNGVVISDRPSSHTDELDSIEMPGSRSTTVHREHRHTSREVAKTGRDHGMLGVFLHVVGDAMNNLGVMVSAIAIWRADSRARYYADPAVGLFIALMIIITAMPLTKRTGMILLEAAPEGTILDDVKHDLERLPGIEVRELRLWRLDQHTSVASARLIVEDSSIAGFTSKSNIIMECLRAYGIHYATLQPEMRQLEIRAPKPAPDEAAQVGGGDSSTARE